MPQWYRMTFAVVLVKAFSKEGQEIDRYNQRIGHVLQLKYKESLAYGLFFGMTGLSGNLIVLSVFYFGGMSMSEESLTIGDLSSFLLYAFWVRSESWLSGSPFTSSRCRWVSPYRVCSPFIWNWCEVSELGESVTIREREKEISSHLLRFSQAVWSILNEEHNEKLQSGQQLQRTIHGQPLTSAMMLRDINFDSISFRYPTRPDVLVLDNLTLRVPGGQVLAICGSSGSGKSTIAQILLRFYNAQSGEIRIGDVPIQDMPLAWLRSNIGTVPQEPVLFSSSIYDNIAYGSTASAGEITENVLTERVRNAADTANASGFIEQLPEKYETKVGERGTMLSGKNNRWSSRGQRVSIGRSGGQKQRVALSRAILRDPSILILVRATDFSVLFQLSHSRFWTVFRMKPHPRWMPSRSISCKKLWRRSWSTEQWSSSPIDSQPLSRRIESLSWIRVGSVS